MFYLGEYIYGMIDHLRASYMIVPHFKIFRSSRVESSMIVPCFKIFCSSRAVSQLIVSHLIKKATKEINLLFNGFFYLFNSLEYSYRLSNALISQIVERITSRQSTL